MKQRTGDEIGMTLLGRKRDVAAIERSLARRRLVTITGLGGIGKTSVARVVAERSARAGRRTVVVDLAPILGADEVPEAIAAATGAVGDAGQPVTSAIAVGLGAAPTLVVLDNFEHVLSARHVVEDLLATVPSLVILVTSRVALGATDEVVIRLGALEQPRSVRDVEAAPASALFLRRARDLGHLSTVPAEDAAALIEVCHRLDGLPLALELAAGWVSVLSPRAIERRLSDHRLTLEGADPRHASLEAIVRATLEFVPAAARDLFPVLGAFAGPFDEAAAAAVADRADVLAAMRALADAGLVDVSEDATGEPRFELLETVRAVAWADLAADRRIAVIRRHASLYANRAVDAAGAVRSQSFSDPRGGAALADPNVLAGFERSMELRDQEEALKIAGSLATRAMQTGFLREAMSRLRLALERAGPLETTSAGVRSDALNALVSLRVALGISEGQEAAAGEALAAARAAADPVRVVRTLITLGNVTTGDRTPMYAEAARLADEVGYGWGAATAWSSLSDAYWDAERPDEAMKAIVRAEAAFERIGDRSGAAAQLAWRAEYELNLDRTDAAIEHLEEAVEVLRAHPGLPFFTTGILSILAVAYARAGQLRRADATLAEAAARVEIAESNDELTGWTEAAISVLESRHPAIAARCLGALERIVDETGRRRVSDRLLAAAAGRIQRAIGTRRLERERASGREAGAAQLFPEVARIVRRSAGPDAGRLEARFGALTAREAEVLVALAEGKTDREIGATLGISAKTASVHVANLKAKLGVESRVEAVLAARDRYGRGGATT